MAYRFAYCCLLSGFKAISSLISIFSDSLILDLIFSGRILSSPKQWDTWSWRQLYWALLFEHKVFDVWRKAWFFAPGFGVSPYIDHRARFKALWCPKLPGNYYHFEVFGMTATGIKPRSSPHEVDILTTGPSHLWSTTRLSNMSTLKLCRCLSRAMQPLFSGIQICTSMFVVWVRSCFFFHKFLLRQSYLGLDFFAVGSCHLPIRGILGLLCEI